MCQRLGFIIICTLCMMCNGIIDNDIFKKGNMTFYKIKTNVSMQLGTLKIPYHIIWSNYTIEMHLLKKFTKTFSIKNSIDDKKMQCAREMQNTFDFLQTEIFYDSIQNDTNSIIYSEKFHKLNEIYLNKTEFVNYVQNQCEIMKIIYKLIDQNKNLSNVLKLISLKKIKNNATEEFVKLNLSDRKLADDEFLSKIIDFDIEYDSSDFIINIIIPLYRKNSFDLYESYEKISIAQSERKYVVIDRQNSQLINLMDFSKECRSFDDGNKLFCKPISVLVEDIDIKRTF